MAKRPDKVIWLDRGWQPVAIGFVPSKSAWDSEMKRLRSDIEYPAHRMAGGLTHLSRNETTGESLILVCCHPNSERDAMSVIMTLVHEAVHVWQFLREEIGEKNPGIELEAYGIEHIAEGLINAYCESQGKSKDWMKG